ncbi:hypothetical protein RFI_39036 [Reticulomyxa filosa]|uniref:Uncharacterized protein n=1 Tax=Reticulomyxa filosa TaxID=46433 RepID=X6L8W4_RETFI|nr:hypothetical protein RFI_39036 [Reticulomyxa filosa]|eukprot:ETN98462.1 hypothetical protein RFI_39036 [Reticulomyxa filosa]
MISMFKWSWQNQRQKTVITKFEFTKLVNKFPKAVQQRLLEEIAKNNFINGYILCSTIGVFDIDCNNMLYNIFWINKQKSLHWKKICFEDYTKSNMSTLTIFAWNMSPALIIDYLT